MFKNLESSKPKFEKKVKIDLPSAFDVPRSKDYLESRESSVETFTIVRTSISSLGVRVNTKTRGLLFLW